MSTGGRAYLLCGADRDARAQQLAQSLLCARGEQGAACGSCRDCRKLQRGIHPDCRTWGEETPLGVEEIRRLREDAYRLPGEAQAKVYLLPRAGEITPQGQNALLKLLEEGPPFLSFLLLCDNPDRLLPTVRSRCLPLGGSGAPDTALPAELSDFLQAAACGDSLALLTALVAWEGESREALLLRLHALREALPPLLAADSRYDALWRGVESCLTLAQAPGSSGTLCGALMAALLQPNTKNANSRTEEIVRQEVL